MLKLRWQFPEKSAKGTGRKSNKESEESIGRRKDLQVDFHLYGNGRRQKQAENNLKFDGNFIGIVVQ